MHGQQCGGPLGDCPLGSGGVERQSLGIDVREHRTSARHHDRHRRVGGRQRRGDDLVAGADAERAKDQRERVGAVADADGVRGAGRRGKLPLECLDFGPQHEPRAIDDAR